MSLHNEIMNIPVQYSRSEFGKEVHYLHYSEGHRDARHSAAELSLKYDRLIEELGDRFGKGTVDLFKRKCGL